MGSFKSPGARQERQGVYVHPSFGPGESITYWRVLPHSAQAALTSAATEARVNPVKRTMEAVFDPGKAAVARLQFGIVGWTLRDEADQPVPWDPGKVGELIDGLDPAVVEGLSALIGEGAPMLDVVQGEGFGESSEPSSTDSPE